MNNSSGGPKTDRGKAAVKFNATQHGLRSDAPVIPGLESFEGWRHHRDGIVKSLQPEGHLETELAEHIASLLWRKRRVARYEVAAITLSIMQTEEDLQVAEAYARGTLGKAGLPVIPPEAVRQAMELRVLPGDVALNNITRYEAHFHRQWVQTLHELEALQLRRKGGQQSPLSRLDFSGPPAG